MCGITGIFRLRGTQELPHGAASLSLSRLRRRGPDHAALWESPELLLGHTRLSIIDTSDAAHQPFSDPSGRYRLSFNGELFNYKTLRSTLEKEGVSFRSDSDTEVLLHLLIREGEAALQQVNGFFAFAFYDTQAQKLVLARDRYGEKPLLYAAGEDQLCFASEMEALLAYPIRKELNPEALQAYLTLSYIPAPLTIFSTVHKLEPGTLLRVENGKVETTRYYAPKITPWTGTREEAQRALFDTLDEAVKLRLVSDVPLGAFLSGGIDSTLVCGLSRRHHSDLRTFSIGFPDHPFFDETAFATAAARYLNTRHEVIPVTHQDMQSALDKVLDCIDEPFADSSALVVWLLSKRVKKNITVALSGDGADEFFGGYNKHRAVVKALEPSWSNKALKMMSPLLHALPGSRSGKIGNTLRQAKRYARGLNQEPAQRYWEWASFTPEAQAAALLENPADPRKWLSLRNTLTETARNYPGLEGVLRNDIQLVLPNDMLYKVDKMSMAHGLEVRSPFLDHRVAELALAIPAEWKTDTRTGKKILRETFAEFFPPEVGTRGKHGFEVPLKEWFSGPLKSRILHEWLEDSSIRRQGVFDVETIKTFKQQLIAGRFNEATCWALIVFQHWWKKYMS